MKKLLSILLAAVLSVSVSLAVFAKELSNTEYNELEKYGILQGDENGDLRTNDNITRAEFCKMAAVMLGYRDNNGVNNQLSAFADVPPEHWAHPYISGAKAISLIDGVGDDRFEPDENITNQDMLKILVSMLGYKPLTEHLGGYPDGFIQTANQIKLLAISDIFNPEAFATRGEAAVMIYSALDIPIMYMKDYGANMEYVIADGTSPDYPLSTLRLRYLES